MVNDIVSHLEMTSPHQLRATATGSLTLRQVSTRDTDKIKTMHDRVASPHGWMSLAWSPERWREFLARPGVTTWLPSVDGDEPVGFVAVQAQAGGEVEIEFFGLVPEFTGRGLGGSLLTAVTEAAWRLPTLGDTPKVRRVWLRTSSHDHQNALRCYQNAGYELFHVEERERELITP